MKRFVVLALWENNFMKSTSLKTICAIAATVRCLNDGQSVNEIATSAKVSPQKVRSWVRQGGYRRIAISGQTKYVFGA